ncbi:response regulator transcription factor [Acidocella sp.]|uniref:response regulator n=1 Tax=Acidocella sp. TaxID=50710 RepID=UPI002620607E|nr:response regulator transcription factor [Acidocella sp.]
MKLLVVEDEPELGRLLCSAFERAGFAVDLATSLHEGRGFLAVAGYDAAVLDLSLPDGDGLSLLAELRRAGAGLPVLILTARDAPEDRVHGLNAGADDYLVKPFHLPELIARIRALLRRPSAALGLTLSLGNLELDTVLRQARVGGQILLLSPREISVLELLLRHQGQVALRASLEDRLYGMDRDFTPNALEVLIHRLRRRLQDAGASPLIHTIRGVGYLMAPPS